jgi:hypothetical protein
MGTIEYRFCHYRIGTEYHPQIPNSIKFCNNYRGRYSLQAFSMQINPATCPVSGPWSGYRMVPYYGHCFRYFHPG